jgi:hypothetical protein
MAVKGTQKRAKMAFNFFQGWRFSSVDGQFLCFLLAGG